MALLERDELSVNELQEITKMGQSRISTHLLLLQDAALLHSRREGKRTFYKLNEQADKSAREIIALAIKGASQGVVVPVSVTQAGGTTTASGAFAIKRLDFKIGDGEWKDTSMVANEVQVKFKLALTGVAPL